MTAYALYNEIDPFAAAWLEQLIARGHIAPGVVDRRSIEDISPDDLRGFRQVHFFAGIGVWSYALRGAGVPDDANVWTGSCPCQPFSAAGKGGGVDDERHLWPHFHHLIRECRPDVVFGEQVASKDGLAWVDLVYADMEGTGYAFGALDTCAAGFGAPHIRQRLYWFSERLADSTRVDSWAGLRHSRSSGQRRDLIIDGSCVERLGDSVGPGLERFPRDVDRTGGRSIAFGPTAPAGAVGGLADNYDDGFYSGTVGELRDTTYHIEPCGSSSGLADPNIIDDDRTRFDAGDVCGELWGSEVVRGQFDPFRLADPNDGQLSEQGRRSEGRNGAAADSRLGGRLADDASSGWREERSDDRGSAIRNRAERVAPRPFDGRSNCGTGPTNGFWADVDWLHCRDERWRPVEPFTFPLAHGAAARVGRLRGYGNAINAEQAIGFLEAFFEAKAIEVAAVQETTRDLDAGCLTAELIGDLL